MENTAQNTQIPPIQNQPPVMHPAPKQNGQGALVGSIIIIILIVLGALFVLKNTQNPTLDTQEQNEQQMLGESQDQIVDTNTYVDSQSSISGSDELSDLGTEIDGTDIDSVDYGVDTEFK